MESAQDNIYTQYKDICDNGISSSRCAFSNLTYNQWFSGAVLSNPLPNQVVSSVSYAQNYANYTQLFVSPELGQFMTKSEQTMPDGATIGDVYQSFNSSGLYNGKIFQDILLNFDTMAPGGATKWSNIWTTESFQSYLRFVTLNYGLTGMFTYRSPREMIEGYNDTLIM